VDTSTRLTRAVVQTGRPVIRHTPARTLLRAFTGNTDVVHAEEAVSFAGAVQEGHATDGELAVALVQLLKRASRSVAQARFATFLGVGHLDLFRVAPKRLEESVTVPRVLIDNDREWGRSATIFLNAEAPAVRLARRRAKTDVAVAAHLLCRALLVIDGPLEANVVDRLLVAAGDG
jgi:hypothetical protein